MEPHLKYSNHPEGRGLLWVLVLSLLLHLLFFVALSPIWPWLTALPESGPDQRITVLIEVPEAVPLPEPEPPPSGQIVDTAPTPDPRTPVDAAFLAEHNRTVEEETRTDRFRINPDVLAQEYATEDKLEFEELTNLDMKDPSTGAQVGNDRFDPSEDGALASLPSPFHVTNREGLQRPVPASHRSQSLSGAPNNDLVDVKEGDRLALNTREILFAGYLNRIRRLVNFYWSQSLDNLPGSAGARLTRSSYTTGVFVVLDGEGALESIDITQESGSRIMDHAVVKAFRIAGPFPHPPEQLIAPDGRVYLPDFDFTVQLGRAQAVYRGVDPRAGIRFPGILKATR